MKDPVQEKKLVLQGNFFVSSEIEKQDLPAIGADIPLYNPRTPSFLIVFEAQSIIPRILID